MILLVACSTGDTQAGPTAQALQQQPNTTADGNTRIITTTGMTPAAGVLADWIVNPATLPEGRVGKNNCTFPFGQDVPQWDLHPEASCWEHAGPDGWTRQQFQKIHIPQFPSCGGGPGDATAIRVCRLGGQGQPAPCFLNPVTGPNGCARCVVNPTCH
jgi:hypothetical protein